MRKVSQFPDYTDVTTKARPPPAPQQARACQWCQKREWVPLEGLPWVRAASQRGRSIEAGVNEKSEPISRLHRCHHKGATTSSPTAGTRVPMVSEARVGATRGSTMGESRQSAWALN